MGIAQGRFAKFLPLYIFLCAIVIVKSSVLYQKLIIKIIYSKLFLEKKCDALPKQCDARLFKI